MVLQRERQVTSLLILFHLVAYLCLQSILVLRIVWRGREVIEMASFWKVDGYHEYRCCYYQRETTVHSCCKAQNRDKGRKERRFVKKEEGADVFEWSKSCASYWLHKEQNPTHIWINFCIVAFIEWRGWSKEYMRKGGGKTVWLTN